MAKEESGKEKILAAIRRAAAELGRAPSRGELRRITGVSHYRVLSEFPTLRDAVRAAGLDPNPKGEKISTEDMLSDWKRVADKLGRRPSRAEYVREGKYSAGAFVGRFGSWGRVSTTEDTEEHEEKKPAHHGGTETRRKTRGFNRRGRRGRKVGEDSRELTRRSRINHELEKSDHKGSQMDSCSESVLHNFDCVPLAPVPVPAPVVGMRRVTEEVAQMVVNTLMGRDRVIW